MKKKLFENLNEDEKKLRSMVFRILPERSFLPVASVLALQFVTYYVPKLVNAKRPHVELKCSADDRMPFVPPFIVFYVLAFFQWARYYLVLAREEREVMDGYLLAGAMAKLACMASFIAVPTAIERPDVSGGGFFKRCCGIVYRFDEPTNLFPSMHCLESWFCLRLSLEQDSLGRVPEITRSIVKGYSGEMIHKVNRKEWKQLKEDLVQITGTGKNSLYRRLMMRRKWQLEEKLTAAADDAAEATEDVGEIYVRVQALRNCLLSACVFASTVLVRQHYLPDVVSAIVLGEISLFAGKKLSRRISRGR